MTPRTYFSAASEESQSQAVFPSEGIWTKDQPDKKPAASASRLGEVVVLGSSVGVSGQSLISRLWSLPPEDRPKVYALRGSTLIEETPMSTRAGASLPSEVQSAEFYNIGQSFPSSPARVIRQHFSELVAVENDLETQTRFFRRKIADVWRGKTKQALDQQLSDLTERMVESMAIEDDWPLPTPHAKSSAIRVVPQAYHLMRTGHADEYARLPIPFVSTDDTGGLRIRWKFQADADTRELRVNFGSTPTRRTYIYYQSGTQHGTTELNAQQLSERLHWLFGG